MAFGSRPMFFCHKVVILSKAAFVRRQKSFVWMICVLVPERMAGTLVPNIVLFYKAKSSTLDAALLVCYPLSCAVMCVLSVHLSSFLVIPIPRMGLLSQYLVCDVIPISRMRCYPDIPYGFVIPIFYGYYFYLCFVIPLFSIVPFFHYSCIDVFCLCPE